MKNPNIVAKFSSEDLGFDKNPIILIPDIKSGADKLMVAMCLHPQVVAFLEDQIKPEKFSVGSHGPLYLSDTDFKLYKDKE